MQTPHISIPTSLLLQNSGSQNVTIQVSFRTQVAKTLTYPVMCPFPLFVVHVITIHQYYGERETDGQTDKQAISSWLGVAVASFAE